MSKADVIREKLEGAFPVDSLEVMNESAKHRGHAGDDGTGESHFRLIVVSSAFEGMSRIEMQKKVFSALGPDLVADTHSISLKCSAPIRK